MRRWLLAVAFSGAAPLLWGVVGVPGVAAQDAEHVVTASGSSFHASSGPVVVDAKEALALMAPRRHGTCPQPVQESLRWGCDRALADQVTCFNRHYAEESGYWAKRREFLSFLAQRASGEEITFNDAVTGAPLFVAPRGRSLEAFVEESRAHGWPSFRDDEVVWSNVRVLPGGEAVSASGSHLGHNLPDRNGNRYCINLVSISGMPISNSNAA